MLSVFVRKYACASVRACVRAREFCLDFMHARHASTHVLCKHVHARMHECIARTRVAIGFDQRYRSQTLRVVEAEARQCPYSCHLATATAHSLR